MKVKEKVKGAPADYEGDRSKWTPPTTWLGRLLVGSEPNHSWCTGKFEEIGWSGWVTHTVYEKCNVCGAIRHFRPDY